jgi:phosphohistidine swiveling domain-containing protein
MREKIWVCDDEPSTRFPVFTRGNVGEVFSEAVSPLTWSAYGPHSWEPGWRDALVEMGVFTHDEFRPAGECEILCCFGSYIYINVSINRVMAVRIPGLTTEAIDASFFGDYAAVPPYKPDPRDPNPQRTAQVGAWLQSLFTTDPKLLTDQNRVRIDALIARRPDFGTLPDLGLLGYFRSIRTENRHIFKRHLLNTYGCNVLTSMIAQICAAAGASDRVSRAISAIGDVDSTLQAVELWELSRSVRSSPALTAAFDEGVEGLLDRLRVLAGPAAGGFLAQWDAFIDHWGIIGPNVWEFRSPTYRSDPGIALRMLDRARRAPDSSSPAARSSTSSAEREAAIADVAGLLAGNAEMQRQFMGAARSAGNYLAARERSKVQCTIMIDEGRTALRELGGRLVKRGLLSRWEDLLLVTDGEADAFVADPAAHAALIAGRASRLEMLMAKEPPFVFEGEPPPLSAFKNRAGDKPESAAAGTRLTGIGVSPGRYTGLARVITSLGVDSELQPGEVIVAATTDASWGPLFLVAGAVVVETGAAISHAAIVARELGIPAAVSVIGATSRIRDGSRITVDGGAGTVILH